MNALSTRKAKTMDPTRRACTMLPLGLLTAPMLALAANDHSAEGPYSKLPQPLPTEAAGKIEVIEFFWYGCPHCAKVEPELEAWAKKLPPDVVLRREHIVWDGRPETLTHARIYATLRGLDGVEAHQRAVFEAVHKERLDLRNEKALLDWAARRNIDRARFESMYKSFGIQSQVARSKGLTATYRIEGVPTFIVNGKYATEPHRAGGERQVFEVIDGLVAQERAALKR